MRPEPWSEAQVEALKTAWLTDKPVRVIAEEIGRSKLACLRKAQYLKLPSRKNVILLSLSDMAWFKANYPHVRTGICALRLGVCERTCQRIAKRMGIAKTEQFLKDNWHITLPKALECRIANARKRHTAQGQ